ncbi:MAG: hypothetical protein ABIJ09_03775 [Pseudomonadota bacterium]
MAGSDSIHNMGLSARKVQRGETLPAIAKKLFSDERVATLLEDINPELRGQGPQLVEGQALRIPSRDYVQQWAQRLGMALPGAAAAGHGTRARRKWNAFAGPSGARPVIDDALARLVKTHDFGELLDEVADLDTAGRGHAVWGMLSRLGEAEMQQALGQKPASSVEASIEQTAVRLAVDNAVVIHVADQVSRVCAEALEAAAEAVTCTLHKPERLARLVLALGDAGPERSRAMLGAMGLPAERSDEIARAARLVDRARGLVRGLIAEGRSVMSDIETLAEYHKLDLGTAPLARLLDRAPSSSAARDRLIVQLAGLAPVQDELHRKLTTLHKVLAQTASSLRQPVEGASQRVHAAQVARQLPFVDAVVRQRLAITSPTSPLGRALDELQQAGEGKLHPLLQLATRLPAVLGSALLSLDAATLERGLAALVKVDAVRPAAAPGARGVMSAADLMARAALSSAGAGTRKADVQAQAACAAWLSRATLRVSGPVAGPERRRVEAAFRQRFLASDGQARRPGGTQLRDEVMDLLQGCGQIPQGPGDAALRERRALQLIQRQPALFDRIVSELPEPLPPAGRRRHSARGVALVIAAMLLEHAGALGHGDELAQALCRGVVGSGGQVLESALKILLGARA